MRPLRALLLACVLLSTSSCAGAIPFITAIVAVTNAAVHWAEAIKDFVAPRVDDNQAQHVSEAVAAVKAAAAILDQAASIATAADDPNIRRARAELSRALAELYQLTAPFGVRVSSPAPEGTPEALGASSGTFTVPPAEVVVYGPPQS